MDAYALFFQPYENYDGFQILLELLGTVFGLISVYFSIKKNIWVFPTGIISTLIYVYILFSFGLLGDAIINVYYTIMSIYGWVLWYQNANDHIHIESTRATKKDWMISGVLFLLSNGMVLFLYFIKPWVSDSEKNPFHSLHLHYLDWGNWLDVITTSIFLVGMWLMAKRKVENWLFWIIGDLICVPMMIFKELGITSVQYLVFTIMAIIGWRTWNKNTLKTL